MKYYKVVKKNLFSIWAPPEFAILYKIGEWVEPKIKEFPLAVFDNFIRAKNFSYGINGYIYECEIKGRTEKPWLPASVCFFKGDIFHMLELIAEGKPYKQFGALALPRGTITCQSVKLIKEVTGEL
jgi:hypothetical protein